MTIGQRIKAKREAIGMSQVALADAIGEKKQTLYKYENSIITNIPIEKIEQIAKALSTTPAHLMGWADEVVSRGTPTSNDDIKFALFGTREIDDDVLDRVKQFAKFAQENEKNK